MLTLLMQALTRKFWTYLMFLLLFKLVVIPTMIQLKLIKNQLISASLFSLLGESRTVFNHVTSYMLIFPFNKRGCVFPMVIWPAFRMGQYRVNDHPYHAPQFI